MIILYVSILLVVLFSIAFSIILIRNEFILKRKRILLKHLQEKMDEWEITKDYRIIKENEAIIKELKKLKIL